MNLRHFLFILLFTPFFTSANIDGDRDQIVELMKHFHQWDQTGGKERMSTIFAEDVRYNRVDEQGNFIGYSVDPDYKGRGKDAYIPFIIELDIYGNMAIVKTLHHYPAKGSYIKAFVLHQLKSGWRITNVSWGAITPGA